MPSACRCGLLLLLLSRGCRWGLLAPDAAVSYRVCSINCINCMDSQPRTLHLPAMCLPARPRQQEQEAAEGQEAGAAQRQCTLCLEGLSDVEAVLGCRPPGPHQLYRSYFVKFKGKSYRWVGADLAGR